MRTEALIDLLSRDARVRSRFGGTVLTAAAIGLLVAALVFLAMLRPRHDLADAAGTARFLFKFAVTLPLTVVTLGLLDRLGRPAAPRGIWPFLLAGVAAVLAAGIGLELASVPSAEWSARLVGRNWRYCVLFIPLISLGPLLCLVAALRQGMPERPGLAGAMAGLAASGIGASLYATHCVDDSPLFVATWYVIAAAIVTACGYAAGRRFLGS